MTHFSRLNGCVLFIATLLLALTTVSLTQGQDTKGQPTAVAQRPFDSLSKLLSSMDDNYTKLGELKQKISQDKERVTKDAKALQTERARIDQEEAALEDMKKRSEGAGFRVKLRGDRVIEDYHFINHPYKDFATYEDAAAWLEKVGGNGRVLDKATNKEVNAPPPKPDKTTIRDAERRLAQRKRAYETNKRHVEKEMQNYATEVNEYNSLADNFNSQKAALPRPEKALETVRLTYDESVPKGGKRDPAFTKALDQMKQALANGPVGDGQCTSLAKALNNLGPAGGWKPDEKVMDSKDVRVMKAAATFFKDSDGTLKYLSYPHGNHTVVVADVTKKGALVFDQWSGKAPGFRIMKRQGGMDDPDNQAKIKKGEEEAKAKGLSPDDPNPKTRARYYKQKYKYYSPGNDADNLRYIKESTTP